MILSHWNPKTGEWNTEMGKWPKVKKQCFSAPKRDEIYPKKCVVLTILFGPKNEQNWSQYK